MKGNDLFWGCNQNTTAIIKKIKELMHVHKRGMSRAHTNQVTIGALKDWRRNVFKADWALVQFGQTSRSSCTRR